MTIAYLFAFGVVLTVTPFTFCHCSESSLAHVSIQWNLEALVPVLQFIHGFQLHITSNNFLLILEVVYLRPHRRFLI